MASGYNFIAQAVVCALALISLQQASNTLPPLVIIVITTLGFALIGVLSVFSGYSRKLRAIYTEGRAAGRAAGYRAGLAAEHRDGVAVPERSPESDSSDG